MLKDEDGEDEENNHVKNRPVTEFTNNEEWSAFVARYMREHIYMYNGSSEEVKIRAYKTRLDHKGDTVNTNVVNHLRDWFGDNVTFMNETEITILANVYVNVNSMLFWALQYGQSVEILNPPGLREAILKTSQTMYERYSKPVK